MIGVHVQYGCETPSLAAFGRWTKLQQVLDSFQGPRDCL